ncbi:hypothetical protein Lser_V15G03292 [Lactuca serriola]
MVSLSIVGDQYHNDDMILVHMSKCVSVDLDRTKLCVVG